MSGHNKWSKIKHKKATSDARKSQVFGKLVRLIASESKQAKGDASAPSLRAAIEKARAENMPMENINRAIAKGKIDKSAALDVVLYETYGPGGTAIIVEGLTDNRNRTAGELKHLLSKHGYELAAPGSASWAFENKTEGWTPKTTVELSDEDLERLQSLVDALEGHDDIQRVSVNVA